MPTVQSAPPNLALDDPERNRDVSVRRRCSSVTESSVDTGNDNPTVQSLQSESVAAA